MNNRHMRGHAGRLLTFCAGVILLCPALAAAASDTVTLQEVVVTATRRQESIQKVPVSVTAFTQAQMDTQGIKQIDDLLRFTPGLSLSRSPIGGANEIAIRGISSSAGTGTTGVYIDDTPIQVINLGYSSGIAFPALFDVQRVEVLRGPQGTLFGAGSEGGTVRFITTEPSLTEYTTYDRAEVAHTENGAPSYEGGAAFGGPIIDDRVGFRVSAFYRYDGGFIDAVNGTNQIVDPTGASYGNSVAFTPTSKFEDNINWNQSIGARAALTWKVNDELTITPSVYYQKLHDNDGQGTVYWPSQSNPSNESYTRPFYIAGSPATDPSIAPMNAPNNQWGNDAFTLSTLHLAWDLAPGELLSNTSYFHRNNNQWYDYTQGYYEFYECPGFPCGYPPSGWKAMANYSNGQANFVQELRLQSDHPLGRLSNWVVGVFFAHNRQTASEPISANFLQNASQISFGPGTGVGVPNGMPFGPGSTAYENYLGVDLLPNDATFFGDWRTVERQIAAFGQTDVDLTEKLKLTLGVRVSNEHMDFAAQYAGGDNNGNPPLGQPCPAASCALGQPPFTPQFPASTASSSSTSTTPKVSLSYQLSQNNMAYATAAKGFRPGGGNIQVPTACALDGDLKTYGYLNAQGQSTDPATYKPDSVWSYEIGSKNGLFGGRMVIDSSAYLIKWKNMQTNVLLPDCGYNFVDNLGSATSKGFDLGFQARPWRGLTLSGAVGYTDATFDRNATSPSGVVLFEGGSGVPGSGPPWTLSLSAEYDMLFEGRDAYIHGDWTHTTTERRTGQQVPGDPQYDPLLFPDPAYSMLNARAGVRFGAVDVSLFVNNLTGAHPLLDSYLGGLPGYTAAFDPEQWTFFAIRPRTFGLTLVYRR